MPDVRKSDIDRIRERLRANVEEFPELAILLDDLPDDYDPEAEPAPEPEQ